MQPWMTACLILCWSNPSPAFRLREFLAKYKAGRHMQDADTIVPEFRSFMTFYRARSVEMQVLDNRPIIATIDGECAPVMELKAEVLPSALNVLLPRPGLRAARSSVGCTNARCRQKQNKTMANAPEQSADCRT